MAQVNVRVDDDLHDWLIKAAKKYNTDVAKIVRTAVCDLKEQVEIKEKHNFMSQTDRLLREDGFFYLTEANNGDFRLKRVKREPIDFTGGVKSDNGK